jgi:hypothetical protein
MTPTQDILLYANTFQWHALVLPSGINPCPEHRRSTILDPSPRTTFPPESDSDDETRRRREKNYFSLVLGLSPTPVASNPDIFLRLLAAPRILPNKQKPALVHTTCRPKPSTESHLMSQFHDSIGRAERQESCKATLRAFVRRPVDVGRV